MHSTEPQTPKKRKKITRKQLVPIGISLVLACLIGIGSWIGFGVWAGQTNWDRHSRAIEEIGHELSMTWHNLITRPEPETVIKYVEVEKEVVRTYPVVEYVYPEEPEIAYVWVNNLRMRDTPYLHASSIDMIPEGEFVTILDGPTDHTSTVELREEWYDEPWYKVETNEGEIGWVYGGGILTDHFPINYEDWKYGNISTENLYWSHKEWDFGSITQGEIVRHTFTLTNDHDYPITIESVKPSCGCTTPDWTQEPIPSGESGEITLEFDSKGKTGRQHKTVTVVFHRGDLPQVLTFSGEVAG